jgi:hypothetical protein
MDDFPEVELGEPVARSLVAAPDGGEQIGFRLALQGFDGRNLTRYITMGSSGDDSAAARAASSSSSST